MFINIINQLNHYERYSCSSNFYDLDPPFRSVLKFQAFFRNQQMDDRPGSVLNLDHPTILVDHPAPMSSMIIPYGTYYDLFYHSLVVGWSSKYDIMYIYIYTYQTIPYHTITVQYITYIQSNTQEDRWVIDNDVGIGFYHFYLFRGCYFCIYTVYGITPLVDL